MRRWQLRSLQALQRRCYSSSSNLIQIVDGTFYKTHPSGRHTNATATSNPPLFPNTSFKLEATSQQHVGRPVRTKPHWAVVGTSPTAFLNALRGDYVCVPTHARTYPYLSSDEIAQKDQRLRIPSRAIQYVGFNNGSQNVMGGGVRGAYLSARYESRVEETDWTVRQFLEGDTELNPSEDLDGRVKDKAFLSDVVKYLRMEKLLEMPTSRLSNGQTRRSRIAKALLAKPELLLLDEPFMGLDPPTIVSLNSILRNLAYRSSPLLLLGLRPQDPIPDWITHLLVLGQNNTIALQGTKSKVLHNAYAWSQQNKDTDIYKELDRAYGSPLFSIADSLTDHGVRELKVIEEAWTMTKRDGSATHNHKTATGWLNAELSPSIEQFLEQKLRPDHAPSADAHDNRNTNNFSPSTKALGSSPNLQTPLVELNEIVIRYGPRVALGHGKPLNLTINQGTRLALLGPNGSGKTTLLSLLTSDHPHSYSLPIKYFGRTRLPEIGKPGLSLWEIQSRVGHSSPEVHAFFPKHLTIREALESAWAETYTSKPKLTPAHKEMVDHFLHTWQMELKDLNFTKGGQDSLEWASDKDSYPRFGRLSFGTQRLLLLLRAIIKQPDIIILDEAFSGLPAMTRDKALAWLERGAQSVQEGKGVFSGLENRQALVVVSHVKEEVPHCVNEWVRLPSEEEVTEQGREVETGRCENGEINTTQGWNRIWGL